MTESELLFAEWKNQRLEYANFCEDGILVEKEWEVSNPKILFLLKETYSHFIDISGPMGPQGTSRTFWRKMKIWTYVVTEYFNNRIPQFDELLVIKEKPNDSIAYVNIKKNAEKIEGNGDPYSDDTDILSYLKKDSNFLRRQIDLIKPEIIFCCSTIIFIKELYPNLIFLSNNLFQADGKLVIAHGHPSSRKSYQREFDDLSTILQKIDLKIRYN